MLVRRVQSSDFTRQKCLNKEVIQIQIPELSLTKPEQVEACKGYFEGLDTTVNVQNKEPRILDKKHPSYLCMIELRGRSSTKSNKSL